MSVGPTFERMLTAPLVLAGEDLILHPYRALYWPRLRWLVVSDLHLGKAAHFRKAGAALPEGSDEATLLRLDRCIADLRPERLLVLGDLFHSSHNNSWERFRTWCSAQRIAIHLVPGNHDILADRRYAEADIQVCADTLEEGPFVFGHEAMDRPGVFSIGGHIHPGVVLTGKGRQRLRLPCFWSGERQAVLPAFGTSTGMHEIRPERTDLIFACTDNAVLDLNGVFAGKAVTQGTK